MSRDDKKKKKKPWWEKDPWFGDFESFDEIFKMLSERMFQFPKLEEMIEDLIKGMRMPSKMEKRGPFVWGFSVTVGPDKKPMVREFGNVEPSMRGATVREDREPLVEVIDEADKIVIVAEMPGVEKKDIQLKATEDSVTISAETPERKYSKRVDLYTKVDPKSSKAIYKNGVLEVEFEKVEKGEEGTAISVG
ncbi:MAG: archaeal heat shock protein Hsp20 [Candidatus Hodarchaeota archaeon]